MSMSIRISRFAFYVGIVLTCAGAGRALAQNTAPQTPEAQSQPAIPARRTVAERQLLRLTKNLDLTSDQQNQIKPLLVDRQQRLDALFKDQSVAEEDRSAKAKAIVQEAHNKIEALLTAEQQTKFKSMLRYAPNGANEQ